MIELELVMMMTPEEKSNLQALARVDNSIVALVGQCVPLTGNQVTFIIIHTQIVEIVQTLCV